MRLATSILVITLSSGCADAAPSAPRQAAPSTKAPAPASAPASAPAARATSAPVRIEPAIVDFGFVRPHTVCEATAQIVNDTDQPLTIKAAQPTCQCTTVDLVGKVVPAHGKLEFPVKMKVSSTGQKLAAVHVVVTDAAGEDSLLKVDLRAEVVYSIRAVTQNPPGGTWDPYIDASRDPTRVRGEITVSSLDGKPFRVLSVGARAPTFVDWTPDAPPKASYRVRYDVSAPDCESMPRYLIIETDRPDAPLIDVRVRHQCTHIRPRLHLAEFRANAGIFSASNPGTFEIELKPGVFEAATRENAAAQRKLIALPGPVDIVGVTSLRNDVIAELVDQKSDGEHKLVTVRLTPKPGSTPGVTMFPIRFSVRPPGLAPFEDDFLVYGKIVK